MNCNEELQKNESDRIGKFKQENFNNNQNIDNIGISKEEKRDENNKEEDYQNESFPQSNFNNEFPTNIENKFNIKHNQNSIEIKQIKEKDILEKEEEQDKKQENEQN